MSGDLRDEGDDKLRKRKLDGLGAESCEGFSPGGKHVFTRTNGDPRLLKVSRNGGNTGNAELATPNDVCLRQRLYIFVGGHPTRGSRRNRRAAFGTTSPVTPHDVAYHDGHFVVVCRNVNLKRPPAPLMAEFDSRRRDVHWSANGKFVGVTAPGGLMRVFEVTDSNLRLYNEFEVPISISHEIRGDGAAVAGVCINGRLWISDGVHTRRVDYGFPPRYIRSVCSSFDGSTLCVSVTGGGGPQFEAFEPSVTKTVNDAVAACVPGWDENLGDLIAGYVADDPR